MPREKQPLLDKQRSKDVYKTPWDEANEPRWVKILDRLVVAAIAASVTALIMLLIFW